MIKKNNKIINHDQRFTPLGRRMCTLCKCDRIRQSYLMVEAKPGPWQYHSAVLTDQSPEDICTNIIREKLLEYLPQEVPYTLTPVGLT